MFANKKGQIDQIVTSVIVLFAAFFLMAIFVIISGNIGNLLGTSEVIEFGISDLALENVDSRILMELFLIDEIEYFPNNIQIITAIKLMTDLQGGQALELAKILERKFDSEYSCDKNNEIFIYEVLSDIPVRTKEAREQQIKVKRHVEYPVNFGKLPLKDDQKNFEFGAFGSSQDPVFLLGVESSHTKMFVSDEGKQVIVSVVGNTKC